MKRIILILILILSFSCKAQHVDKVAHFGVGYVSSATTSALTNKQTPWINITIGIGTAFVIGTSKELYDCNKNNVKFNWKDLGWTVAGGAVGAITIRYTIRSTI